MYISTPLARQDLYPNPFSDGDRTGHFARLHQQVVHSPVLIPFRDDVVCFLEPVQKAVHYDLFSRRGEMPFAVVSALREEKFLIVSKSGRPAGVGTDY